MENKRLKNTIVLKGMASNIVEEAIVILRPNVKLKQKQYVDKNKKIEKKEISNDYILKEAQNVILNYINKLEQKTSDERLNNKLKKYKLLKILNIVLIFLIGFILIIK